MKKLITATLLTLAAATANAVPPAPSNVVLMAGGVQFTPKLYTDAANGGGNFQESFDFVQWWEDQSGNKVSLDQIKNDVLANGNAAASNYTLNGVGAIAVDDFASSGELSCNNCELTFKFDGLGFTLDENFFPSLNVTSAMLNVYLDVANDFLLSDAVDNFKFAGTPLPVGAATNGVKWLSAQFVDFYAKSGPANVSDGVFGLSALDFDFSFNVLDDLDPAISGIAANNILENKIALLGSGLDFNDLIGFGLSTQFDRDSQGDFTNILSQIGDGNIRGFAVSAPSTIAFMGLGLFGLAFAARRRNK